MGNSKVMVKLFLCVRRANVDKLTLPVSLYLLSLSLKLLNVYFVTEIFRMRTPSPRVIVR